MPNEQNTGLGAFDPAAVSAFHVALQSYAATLTANFASSTQAQAEDQLKAPVGALLVAAGKVAGKAIVSRTESRVDGVAGRPDLGVDADGLPVGNVELKASGNGAQPEKFAPGPDVTSAAASAAAEVLGSPKARARTSSCIQARTRVPGRSRSDDANRRSDLLGVLNKCRGFAGVPDLSGVQRSAVARRV